jgi:hypothetical protein
MTWANVRCERYVRPGSEAPAATPFRARLGRTPECSDARRARSLSKMLRLLRVAILLVMTLMVLSLLVGIGMPETGPGCPRRDRPRR